MSKQLTLGQAAIGQEDGDTLTLSNQWANVTITYSREDDNYRVTGDLLDVRLQSKGCRNMAEAMSYAMKSLASYQEGSNR